jgi:hypothetical protein
MTREFLPSVIGFGVYALLQILLFQELVLFRYAFCFVYVAYILLLPMETNSLTLMTLAFLMGVTVDVFYNSLGMHASALVVVAYLRNYWLGAITPQGGYDVGSAPTLTANGLQWFMVYAIPMVFVHHAILFFTEAGGFSMFWFTMLKVMASTVFTSGMITLFQYFVGGSRR